MRSGSNKHTHKHKHGISASRIEDAPFPPRRTSAECAPRQRGRRLCRGARRRLELLERTLELLLDERELALHLGVQRRKSLALGCRGKNPSGPGPLGLQTLA